MARSPNDATRFTSTGPSVFAKNHQGTPSFNSAAPVASPSQINFGSAPSNETPQQKIARLRAAAAASKRGQETSFDKSVRVGRIWADRAHRVTAISLIGLTIVSGAVAAAGITDMMLHNRKRRKEWLAEKQAESARDLMNAQTALKEGRATEDQMLLINRERVAYETEMERKNRPGLFKRATNYLYGGLSEEEKKGGRLGSAAETADKAVGSAVEEVKQASATLVEEGRTIGELATPTGGPLDKEAQAAVNTASNAAKSWTSWLTGR
ncbi:hypothetical protein DOTSEDRAFT_177096 [Dothistroma septosporum NZE10]|uniref:Uncharacterized protein n=1 Tax=Dothistroma septosporum (strain NZE10 / CBS 128990) TaxID=675120 RepID=N1PJP4_DOTSN|nr:hypothetical protein DOTSEDRAFT_177096 [Dothistroma septosporum NZE10]